MLHIIIIKKSYLKVTESLQYYHHITPDLFCFSGGAYKRQVKEMKQWVSGSYFTAPVFNLLAIIKNKWQKKKNKRALSTPDCFSDHRAEIEWLSFT